MSDHGACHPNININATDEKIIGGILQLKALIKELLDEIKTLNAVRPDSVPARYFEYYEKMSAKLDRVDRPTDVNFRQLKRWMDEILQMGDAVVGYLKIDVKVRPVPPGLTRTSHTIADVIAPGRSDPLGERRKA